MAETRLGVSVNGATKPYPAVILATCPIPWTATHEFDEDLFTRTVTWRRTHLSARLPASWR